MFSDKCDFHEPNQKVLSLSLPPSLSILLSLSFQYHRQKQISHIFREFFGRLLDFWPATHIRMKTVSRTNREDARILNSLVSANTSVFWSAIAVCVPPRGICSSCYPRCWCIVGIVRNSSPCGIPTSFFPRKRSNATRGKVTVAEK